MRIALENERLTPRTRIVVRIFAVLACLPLLACNPTKIQKAARTGVAEFHRKLDEGDLPGIYRSTDPEFRIGSSERDFSALLDATTTFASSNEWNVRGLHGQHDGNHRDCSASATTALG
jgi:hypothetical protein